MKKNREEDFPFAYLSEEKVSKKRNFEKAASSNIDRAAPQRTLSGQIQILSVIALALFVMLLLLVLLTLWVFDIRKNSTDQLTEQTQASITIDFEGEQIVFEEAT